jgi:hypothetical protein
MDEKLLEIIGKLQESKSKDVRDFLYDNFTQLFEIHEEILKLRNHLEASQRDLRALQDPVEASRRDLRAFSENLDEY